MLPPRFPVLRRRARSQDQTDADTIGPGREPPVARLSRIELLALLLYRP